MSKVSISISLAMARELRDWADEWPSNTKFQRDLINLKEQLDDAMSPGAQRMERK